MAKILGGPMIRVFIGYDDRQPVSFATLVQSIVAKTSAPVSIVPLVLHTLPVKRAGLTPFTFSRFLVPFLCKYKGWAIFLDADILLRGDLAELWAMREQLGKYRVSVVNHEKRRFERASVMLFNNERCGVLTPEYVAEANDLHTIGWAKPEEIGELPPEWNHLVGYDKPNPDAKLVHYTQGVPAFPETADCEHAEEWNAAMRFAGSVQSWELLMSNSVHAAPVMERLQSSNQGVSHGE